MTPARRCTSTARRLCATQAAARHVLARKTRILATVARPEKLALLLGEPVVALTHLGPCASGAASRATDLPSRTSSRGGTRCASLA